MNIRPSRRSFLKSGSALVVSFALSGPVGLALSRPGHAKPLDSDRVGAFLALDAENILTVYTGKVDLGTGIRTALMQMAAEELDHPMELTRLVEGDTDLCPDQGVTWSSVSIQVGGMEIRKAAATARRVLMEKAARELGQPLGTLEVRDGVVRALAGGEVRWGDLIGEEIIELEIDDEVTLKHSDEYRLVGRSLRRDDIVEKATGTYVFAHDIRVPEMVHARMIFPPGKGSKVVSLDEASVADIPGHVAVVRIEDFVAVVAETEWAAIRAREQLAVEWTDWQGLPDQNELWQHVRTTPADTAVTSETGDVDSALSNLAAPLSATYDFAIQVHGPIGPPCAVAKIDDSRVTVWSPSQAPYVTRKELAQALGLPEEDIQVIYAEGASCFGRNGNEDCTVQAALIAREVGRPVRLQWMREDEHRWSPVGPPVLVDIEGGVDADGRISAWKSDHYFPQQSARDAISNLAMVYAGLPHSPVQNPGSMHNNAVAGYNFSNSRTTLHRLESTPLRPSWFRSPGRMQNTFAIESFMDELAHEVGADPVEFRLAHLPDNRGAETLSAAIRRADAEGRPSSARDGNDKIAQGRGIAYARYEQRTYISCVADVEVERETGKIRVLRTIIGHDCGQVINPDGAINQIEGGVIQTVSRTLMEEMSFDRSNVTSTDWASYPIITFPDVPEVICELIERQDEPPWGVAEMAMVVVPPAIANAVFNATGARLRSVPFTTEKVKAALAGN